MKIDVTRFYERLLCAHPTAQVQISLSPWSPHTPTARVDYFLAPGTRMRTEVADTLDECLARVIEHAGIERAEIVTPEGATT